MAPVAFSLGRFAAFGGLGFRLVLWGPGGGGGVGAGG